jgi:pilus assembly protein CpaB
MRRRILAAFAALVLLVVGTAVLVAYVRGADARALRGVQTVDVLVADELIPEGTPGSELASLVRTETMPVKAALEGRVTDLSSLAGRVVTVDLEPGEQLLTSRFVRPADRQVPGTVEVPEGAQELSILIEPQRAVGGRLSAGDTVGLYLSTTMPDGTPTTHALMHHVLVTQVQGAPAPANAETDTASSGGAAPSGSLMVTFAVDARHAEAVVFSMEYGTLWLSLEPADATTDGTELTNHGNIYGKAFS